MPNMHKVVRVYGFYDDLFGLIGVDKEYLPGN